mgnify:CR=1 FL=1
MRHHTTQRMLTLTAVSLLSLSLHSAVYAQSTAPLNPNADDPTEDINLDDIDTGDGTLEDIEDTANDVETVTDDVDAAIQDQLDDISNTVEDTAGDLLDDSDVLSDVDDAFDTVEAVQDAFSSLQQLFSSIFDLDRLFDRLNLDLFDIFEDPLGGIANPGGDDGANTVEISTGALGLPDPKQFEQELETVQTSAFEEVAATQTGGDGSPVIKRDLVTQFERSMTDEVADQTALTEEGQQKLRDNAEAAKIALETSQQLAADSEEQDVSQNILRNLSAQIAAQQQTNSLNTIGQQLQVRDDALRNKMLVDAVRELQGERIQDRRETAAAYSASIVQGGQIILPGAGINPGGV